MSGSIGAITSPIGAGYGILPQLIAESTTVHMQLDTLTEQASTGLVSQTYAGLGGQASIALDLNPQLDALQSAQTNLGQAIGSMDITQTAMTEIQNVASLFVSDIPNLNGLNPSEVDNIAANARSALQQVADALDTQNSGNYVFAGQDTANPPVPNPDNILTSGFYTQISVAVSALGTNGASVTAAATLAIASSNATGTSPFSTYLSQPASAIAIPVVQDGEGGVVQTGLIASANSVSVSTGTSTTGSYMRDLMRALATLGSLSSSQVNTAGFGALVADVGTSLNGVVSAMSTDVGIFGTSQATLTNQQSNLSSTATALTTQLNAVQEVNMTQTISELTSTQSQLQASYRLITGENSMSLLNFLPAATG
jgi:flagellar hook-associated protein 3 FlgL